MRLEFIYQNSNEQIIIGKFRQKFASLINEKLKEVNPFLYERISISIKNEVEPFTFSIIPYKRKCTENQEGYQYLYVKVIFSSSSSELCVAIYNSLIKSLQLDKLKFMNAYLQPRMTIDQNTAIFKTVSPIILHIEDPQWYLKDDQDDLFERFNFYIQRLSSYLLGQKLTIDNFRPLKFTKLAMRYNNSVIQGMEGIFEMKAIKEVLNLIYNTGIGIYRREGFGMLELVKVGGK